MFNTLIAGQIPSEISGEIPTDINVLPKWVDLRSTDELLIIWRSSSGRLSASSFGSFVGDISIYIHMKYRQATEHCWDI